MAGGSDTEWDRLWVSTIWVIVILEMVHLDMFWELT
jgi:hypothetical protein